LSRLAEVLKLVREILGEHKPVVEVIEHFLEDEKEYLNIRIVIEYKNAIAIIREYIYRETVIAYGYYFRMTGYEEWWDNRPHHQELPTYPDHKHIDGKIEPLEKRSIEEFLRHLGELLAMHVHS
jgi:hypothetical protein